MLLALALSLPTALPSARASALVLPSISTVAVNPPAGAEAVPVDTLPVIAFYAAEQSEVTLRLAEVESGEVVSEEIVVVEPGMRLVPLDVGSGLATDTAYEISASASLMRELVVGFTTGTDVATEVLAPELLTDQTVALTYDGDASSGALDLSVDGDATFPSIVVVTDLASGEIVGITLPPAGASQASVWVEAASDAKPDEVCLQATGVDLAGREAAGGELCYGVEARGLGCSSAPGSMAGVAMGIALALGLARRR